METIGSGRGYSPGRRPTSLPRLGASNEDSSMPALQLSKAAVDAAHPAHIDGRLEPQLYFDCQLKGFGVSVGLRSKTFFVQRDLNGKTVRVTLGRYGVLTVAQARDRAREVLAEFAKGLNPNVERKRQLQQAMTLEAALAIHLGSNKTRAARTTSEYKYLLDRYLAAWKTRSLTTITRQDCRTRHAQIGREYGPYVANSAFRMVRAVYNTALKINESLGVNPTVAVDWFPETRRKAAVPSQSLARWWIEVQAIANPVRRDYLKFVLFTGLRRNDAATVRWEHIDWGRRALLVPAPKGGRAFELPLSDILMELLRRRESCFETHAVFPRSPWVFPAQSRSGHISEPREELSVGFTIHGLRNTFITVAESLDISPYAIKMLVNHSTPDRQDVTAGYITPELERLRDPMQRISVQMYKLIGSETGAPVTQSPTQQVPICGSHPQ